jgi:hypothetical protein
MIIKKKEKEEIYGYVRQGDAAAPTINISMLSTTNTRIRKTVDNSRILAS